VTGQDGMAVTTMHDGRNFPSRTVTIGHADFFRVDGQLVASRSQDPMTRATRSSSTPAVPAPAR
jgi:hypothetical protein